MTRPPLKAASSRIATGDVVARRSRRYGFWCVLQVTGFKDAEAEVAALDWFEPTLPTAEQLKGLNWLANRNRPGQSERTYACPGALTIGFEHIAGGQTNARDPDGSGFYGGKADPSKLLDALEARFVWDQYPEETRQLLGKPRRVDFHRGSGEEAIAHVCATPWVTEADLSGQGVRHIDLSRASVRQLTLRQLKGVERITLPSSVAYLTLELAANSTAPRLDHPFDGADLSLTLEGVSGEAPDFKLPGLGTLVMKGSFLDLTGLPKSYPQLTSFAAVGAPGELKNLLGLRRLEQVQELALRDVSGFATSDFPKKNDLEHLHTLRMYGVPKDVGVWATKEFAGLTRLEIDKLRDATWLEQNIGNPFRSWADRKTIKREVAESAFKAYVQAKKAQTGLESGDEAAMRAIAATFVGKLNGLARKTPLETQERDEAATALRELFAATRVPPATVDRWWEQLEDF